MKTIKYNRIVTSKAMSKRPSQSGLVLTHTAFNNSIRIQGINSKLNEITSHLYMEIPFENIDDVIDMLTELKIELSKTE